MAISKLPTGAILDNSITNAKIADDAIGVADLAATGTPSTTTFLRGDNAWAVPIGGVTSVNGVTGAITAAHIATAVEAASGSNTFTDADHTKLSNIEGSATADQTNSEIKTAVEAATSIALGGSPTTTTQAESDNTTKLATTAYVTSKITTLIGGAPSTLNDLNELAAAINDDANYNSTLTTALATKLPLAGGTMTGNIAHAGAFTIDAGNNIALDNGSGNTVLLHNGSQYGLLTATGSNLIIKSGATTALTFSNQHVTASGNFTVNGNILTAGTVDGVDIQTLNTTASAALPKGGGTMTGDLVLGDSVKAKFGASDDLTIYHDGSNSYVRDGGTGDLLLQGRNSVRLQDISGENYVVGTVDGAVNLYYNNVSQLTTTSTGVTLAGASDPTIKLISNASNAARSGTLRFRENDDTNGFDLRYDGSANNFIIDSNNVSNAVVIGRTTGNVGIGKSPIRALDIKASGDPGVRLESASYNMDVLTLRNSNGRLDVGPTSGITIIQNGRTGINHTSPEARLEIDGGSETGLMVRGTVAAETTAIFQGGGTGAVKVLDVRDSGGNSKFSVLQNGTATFVAGNGLATFIVAGGGQNGYYNTEYHNNASNGYTMGFKHGGTTVGTVITTSSATNYNTSSDYRLKENVGYTWDATTRLKQLKPARFNFIADDTNTFVDGFIAHEAATVVPECVTGTKDAMRDEEYEITPAVMDGDTVVTEAVMGTRSVPDMQGIDQSKLVPLLVKTIQELEARITALEAT
jgi:hypothetical protein